jgi:ketosteroid isomerase-like protein
MAAADDEQAIKDAENAWAKAVAARDFAALDSMLAGSLIYAHSTGNIESKQEYLGRMKSGAQKYDSITHESTRVIPYGDTAVAHSIVRMVGTNTAGAFNDRLMMMHVWVKQGGKWRLAAHQTTKLTK